LAEALKEKLAGPLTDFAVQAGTAAVTITICWAIVKILQMLFGA